MKITLPYRFNTARKGIQFFKYAAAFVGLMIVGIIKYGLITPKFLILLLFTFIACAVSYFAILIFRTLHGAVGTISETEVVAQPVSVLGISAGCPSGTFPIARFKAVRVEIISGTADGKIVPHERVYLQGDGKIRDIMIARKPIKDGVAFAQEMAALVNLPVKEVKKPS